MITNANLILFAVLLAAALGLGAWLKHSAELRRRAEQKKLVRRVISSAPAARGSRRHGVRGLERTRDAGRPRRPA